ncbi:TrkA family potassium uptake protein [Halosegnis rubeus]|uniref:TrkA family potassium uptake protein n=1 Tax=Halosegnis rubeus TaxID=2212850 RepID=A0A5N5U5M7_9EURY|nr:TrkA family potassium uptake protein [Halosegnis rubeus]KAB7513844.1 TrkA family potassium uptake protein [Halosegnis rubeus]KAB7514246.1 TrkA family potassium uptake protein [Halosegnis rubeus]
MTRDIIIAGGGRIGFQAAELLAARDENVTIIEEDKDRITEIADAWIATVIQADASDPDILEQAGIKYVDTIAALTELTGLNLAVCLLATQLADGIRTVARVDRETDGAYDRFVDAVVYPEEAGARVVANQTTGREVQTLAAVTGNIEILEIRVPKGAPAAGRTLAEVSFPAGTLVISGEDGSQILKPETTLTPGSQYVVAVEPDVVDEVLQLMHG